MQSWSPNLFSHVPPSNGHLPSFWIGSNKLHHLLEQIERGSLLSFLSVSSISFPTYPPTPPLPFYPDSLRTALLSDLEHAAAALLGAPAAGPLQPTRLAAARCLADPRIATLLGAFAAAAAPAGISKVEREGAMPVAALRACLLQMALAHVALFVAGPTATNGEGVCHGTGLGTQEGRERREGRLGRGG